MYFYITLQRAHVFSDDKGSAVVTARMCVWDDSGSRRLEGVALASSGSHLVTIDKLSLKSHTRSNVYTVFYKCALSLFPFRVS